MAAPDFSGFTYSGPTGPDPNITIPPIDVEPGTNTVSTIDTGSFSGVASFDWNNFVNELGSVATIGIKAATAQKPMQYTPLGNGQILLPNGQVVGSASIFGQGNANLILLIGIGVVFYFLFATRKRG